MKKADYDLLCDELRESRLDTDIHRKALRMMAAEMWVLLFAELKHETPHCDRIVDRFYQEAKEKLRLTGIHDLSTVECDALLDNDSLGG